MKFYAGMLSLVTALLLFGGPHSRRWPRKITTTACRCTPTWQPTWDTYQFDTHHVMLGVVARLFALSFDRTSPANGNVQTVDLKNGTIIYPTGATPTQGERVSLVGYYSNGTFICNRVIIRP